MGERPQLRNLRQKGSVSKVLEHADLRRVDASRQLDAGKRSELGQFMTPAPVARFMASLFRTTKKNLRLLDAGAGTGSLTAAFVERICSRNHKPESLSITAFELDPFLQPLLEETLVHCGTTCERAGIRFSFDLRTDSFIDAASAMLAPDMFTAVQPQSFNCAILNPPYRKIQTRSPERLLLRNVGVETSNLYTGFLALVVKLLDPNGELVAITPRSFCNGPYFRPFRELFLDLTALRHIHVFDSRKRAFAEDDVLQENIIFRAIRDGKPADVTISSNEGVGDEHTVSRRVPLEAVVNPTDPQSFIHLVTDDLNQRIADRMARLDATLDDLGITVSTGRVVDFRARDYLRNDPRSDTVPLIYPTHFSGGFVAWPKPGARKPNAIVSAPETADLIIPSAMHVLVKRFSSKEERRRVVAAVYDPKRVKAKQVGFENHVNYFHLDGKGLPKQVALGLAVYLNSTLLDVYFRQFNGHTQVNATDLRTLRYPTWEQLKALGAKIKTAFPAQNKLDRWIEEELNLADDDGKPDPVRIKHRLEEAESILRELGLPRQQQNERSALTLLALLNLTVDREWANAETPLRGITEMMNFFAEHYGKKYKPNTRETVRRQTVHQFEQAGLVVSNPDKPDRAINSPYWVYQITPPVLELLKSYGTPEWRGKLKAYLADAETLRKKYAKARELERIPVEVAPGTTIELSPGGQNVLVEKILADFCPQFAPGSTVVYVGDAEKKWAYLDDKTMSELGIEVDEHGKFPDVVVYLPEKNWLVLIEAVTSHGPVDAKRQIELRELFKDCKAGLVFVTTFLDRKSMVKYLADIAWETEVWVADEPGHLIHFNGERFLGPY